MLVSNLRQMAKGRDSAFALTLSLRHWGIYCHRFPYSRRLALCIQLAVECIFCSAAVRFVESCPAEGLSGE